MYKLVLLLTLMSSVLMAQDDYIADVDSAFARGNAYMASYQYAKAVPHFYNCVRSEKANKYLNRLAYAYYQLGNYRDAKIYYNYALKNDSTDITPRIYLGTIAEKESDYSIAAGHYDQLIQIDSTVAHYHKLRAKLALRQGEDFKAFYAYSQAIALVPTDIESVGEVAKIYLKLKDLDSAEQMVDKGLTIDVNNKTIRYLKTNIAFKKDDFDTVIDVMTELLAEGDTVVHYQKLLAMSYLEKEQFDLARIQLLKVAEKEKPNELTYYRLAQAYDGLDSLNQSIEAYQKAIEIGVSKNVGAYHKNMGIHYQTLNQWKKAMAAYSDAYYFDQQPEDLFLLARVQDDYYADKNIALRTYRRFLKLKLDPQKHQELIEYTNSRIGVLKTEIFQRGN